MLTAGAALLGLVPSAEAATYYVNVAAGVGDDNRSKSVASVPTSPWQTIKHAVDAVKNDTTTDTIIVRAGTYPGRIVISRSKLTLQAQTGERPKIVGASGDYQVVFVNNGANLVTIKGFEITGGTVANGVDIQGGAHHVTVTENVIHDCGSGGISVYNGSVDKDGPGGTSLTGGPLTGGSDYITVSKNTVYNCCFTAPYQGSGISLHGLTKFDERTDVYHNVVEKNRTYGNIYKGTAVEHTDGNGIIIDLTGTNGPSVLIQNNLAYKNGGRGIHVFKSSNVDVVNNTCYKNVQDSVIRSRPDGKGTADLSAAIAGNVRFYNNIAYGLGGARCNQTYTFAPYTNGTIIFQSNLYFAGAATYGTGDIYGDPMFLGAENAVANFLCNLNGMGVNTGSSVKFSYNDFVGTPRPQNGGIDKGAYEQ